MPRLFSILLFFIVSVFAQEVPQIKSSYYLSDKPLSYKEIKTVKSFKVSDGENLGITDKQCWIKLEIINPSSSSVARVFEFKIPLIDHILLYQEGKPLQRFGQLYPFNQEMESLNNAAFKINLEAHESKIIYLELSSSMPMKTFLIHFSEQEYIKNLILHKQIFVFVYGMLLVMVLYNFFIWLMIREKAYLFYVLFHFVLWLGMISWTGFGFQYLWPNLPQLNPYTYGVLGNLLYGLDILFIVYYLDTKKYLPGITRFLKIYALLFFALALLSLLEQNLFLYEVFGIFETLATSGMIIYLIFKEKLKIAYYVFIAKALLISGNFLFLLSEFGLIRASFFVDNAYFWGAAVEVVLMSLALSYKYKKLESQKSIEEKKRKQTEEMLISKQRLSSIGENFNYLAHQFRQPLSQINSIVYFLAHNQKQGSLDQELISKNLDIIEQQTGYLSRTIDYFHNFTMSKNQREKFVLSEFLEDINAVVSFMFSRHGILFETKSVKGRVILYANPSELLQVLMILLTNAKDALMEHDTREPKIILETSIVDKSLIMRVANNGGEIPFHIHKKIFEPYFSTRGDSEQRGLGLYIARLIVEEKLHSAIEMKTGEGKTSFIIQLNQELISDISG